MTFIDQVVILLVGLMPLVLILALVSMVLILTLYESEYGVLLLWTFATLIAYIAEVVNIVGSMNCGLIQIPCSHSWLLPGWAYFIWLVIGVVAVIVVKAQEKDEIKRVV